MQLISFESWLERNVLTIWFHKVNNGTYQVILIHTSLQQKQMTEI